MTAKRRKTIRILAVIAAVLAVLIVYMCWENTVLELNTYAITSDLLPDAFDGYRIAHVSDLHNAEMGEDSETLLTMLREAKPDIIAVTGDLIDSRNTDIEIALAFAEEAIEIAPCYYVTGNHEARVSEYDELKSGLIELGITVLEDEKAQIEIGDAYITILGLQDPSFQTDYLLGDDESIVTAILDGLQKESDGYTVLLSHRPELFDIYVGSGVDLVLSGHAHGGQFRLPFIGGLVAPNQGFFPEYDAGLYSADDTNMIVSRGIGNSILPFRFNNLPEVILIELLKV